MTPITIVITSSFHVQYDVQINNTILYIRNFYFRGDCIQFRTTSSRYHALAEIWNINYLKMIINVNGENRCLLQNPQTFKVANDLHFLVDHHNGIFFQVAHIANYHKTNLLSIHTTGTHSTTFKQYYRIWLINSLSVFSFVCNLNVYVISTSTLIPENLGMSYARPIKRLISLISNCIAAVHLAKNRVGGWGGTENAFSFIRLRSGK